LLNGQVQLKQKVGYGIKVQALLNKKRNAISEDIAITLVLGI
jgi:hypothetical protein